MSSLWVLIVLLHANGPNNTMATQTFHSQSACEAAKQWVRENVVDSYALDGATCAQDYSDGNKK